MKKMIFLFIGIAMVLHGASLLPSASAYMVHLTETYSNRLVTADVEATVREVFDKDNSVKSSIKVENTGELDAYIRVRLVGYWQDSKGYPVGLDFIMPTITINSTDWIASTAEPYTYYYKHIVPKYDSSSDEDLTNELITGSISLTMVNDPYNGVNYEYYPVIEVFAEAIQAEGTTDTGNVPAVEDAWNVTLDSAGNITGIKD